jgi:uncharacterized protein DUF4154
MRSKAYSTCRQVVRIAAKIVTNTILAAFCWISIGGEPKAHAASAPAPEYLIKAAYIYNFAMFVEWPVDAFLKESSPIVIGILGADPFGPAIDQIVQDKKIDKRPLVVKRLHWGQEFKDCHILFISTAETARVAEVVNQLKAFPTLLVAESPGLSKQGATINFVVEDNKVRCEVNVDAAKRAGLSISSKLLNLAKVIKGS